MFIALNDTHLVMCITKEHTLNNTVKYNVDFLKCCLFSSGCLPILMSSCAFFKTSKQNFTFINIYLVSLDPLFCLPWKLIEFYRQQIVRGQPCLTFCDPVDCSPPGSSVHGIFQARILEWVVISYFMGSFQPRDVTCVSCVSCIDRQIYHCDTVIGS